jgi:hypothetical protein
MPNGHSFRRVLVASRFQRRRPPAAVSLHAEIVSGDSGSLQKGFALIISSA